VRRRLDLAPAGSGEADRVVLGAARLGATRLIDNLEF
jgi:pantoate--beta-alanine ligase